MYPRLQKLALDWKTYVALIAAAVTAMSAFTDLVTRAAGTVSAFKDLSPQARWLVAAVFLVLTIVFLLAALSRRSVLIEKKRFLLSPENPEHLVGREEEVAHLARQCGRHSLVFLVGDSGTGKSALVRAGLAHGLLAQEAALAGNDFVPLVVDLSCVGWQRGLSLTLARGLGKLPENEWKTLGGGDRPAAETVFRWLRTRPAHAPRRLLIILDQFDDYLAVHRSQFYDGTTLRRPQEIEERSTDWRGLAELLRSGAVTVLVVARSEAAGSLPALCFVEDAAIAREHLTRLPGNLVAPLLNHLSEPLDGQSVISDPEFGWLQLRSRLLRDLQAAGEGQILPIQLSVALNSLRLSRYLTPAEYERQGGLRGLERLHVERHAEKAATAARVPTAAILEALLTMVSPDGSKTRPVPRTDFDSALGRHGATPEAAGRAILQLEDDRLLRRVLDEGDGTESLLLYHDYLARGVREAYRQANRWTELLRERAQLFQEAMGWRQSWRALLSPAEQTRLLWERLRGRFSFNGRLRFFGFSTAKWLPIMLALLLVGVGGWEVDRYRKNQIAAEVMQAIGHQFVTGEEAHQLLRLSAAGRSAATHALRLAIEDAAIARRASRRVDQLVMLAVGMDLHGERSHTVVEEIVEPTLGSTKIESESAVFVAAIASKLHLTSSARRQVARSITARMKIEPNRENLARLGKSLALLSAKLERQDVSPGAAALVAQMKSEVSRTDGIDSMASLSEVLGSLSAKLERQDVASMAAVLLTRLKAEHNSYTLAHLSESLGSLSAKLETRDIAPVAAALTARMKAEPDSGALARLGTALGSLRAKLKSQDVALGAAALVARMRTEADSGDLANLCIALSTLSPSLERQDAVPMAAALVARMKAEPDIHNLVFLGDGLGSLSLKLESQDVAPGVAALLARMKAEPDVDNLAYLSHALGSLSTKLDREEAASVVAALLAQMNADLNSSTLASLGEALGLFSAKMKGEVAFAPAFEVLVARASRNRDEYTLPRLADSLVALGPALPNPITLSFYPHPVRVEQVYVDLLKSPLIVGAARAELLKGLEQATGQTFSGDMWSFVDWATETDAGRALKLDLEGPPPWLDASDD